MTEAVKAPAPGTPEHDAAMAAKVDENTAKAAAAASPEPVVEAPKDTPKAEEKPTEEPKKAPEENQADAAKEAVESVGVKYDELQAEYAEKGELSEESYAKLAKVGFGKEVVEAFIAGQEALRAAVEARGMEAAGGRERFLQMQDWAKTSMTQGEIEAYNKAVVGTEEEMIQAVRGLRSRFESEYGRQPNLLGGSPAGSSGGGYSSRAEMTADMRDPRYAKDPAFRAKVAQRVASTTAF